MIQRIQSVYLLAVAVISIGLFFTPFASKLSGEALQNIQQPDTTYVMNIFNVSKTVGTDTVQTHHLYHLALLNVVIILIAFYIIMQYKKRVLQMKLCKLMILLLAVFIAIIFYEADKMGADMTGEIKSMYLAGSYFPIIQIILVFLANNAIRKDEELVRSADRIR